MYIFAAELSMCTTSLLCKRVHISVSNIAHTDLNLHDKSYKFKNQYMSNIAHKDFNPLVHISTNLNSQNQWPVHFALMLLAFHADNYALLYACTQNNNIHMF